MFQLRYGEKLPGYAILGANAYAKIRTSQLRIGRQGEPVVELTHFVWAIMSPGEDLNPTIGCLATNTAMDHKRLYALDVLDLADSLSGAQSVVYQEFCEQLVRDGDEGWYETALPWKGDHPPLFNYHNRSLCRLNTQVRKLRKSRKREEYDAITREQLKEGIFERAPNELVGREYYMAHRAVIREGAESSKMHVVYDYSVREGEGNPSLNDCFDLGPPLQNKLWDVLVRGQFHPVALAGDLKKAFFQVRIREDHDDALRFHWLRLVDCSEVETLRFTRALLGLGPSSFLLGGIIEQHLSVHKCHSNVLELEDQPKKTEIKESTNYAKQQLGASAGKCKLLGLGWDKVKDAVSVAFPDEKANLTKRGILGNLAHVYDPLVLVSPMTL